MSVLMTDRYTLTYVITAVLADVKAILKIFEPTTLATRISLFPCNAAPQH